MSSYLTDNTFHLNYKDYSRRDYKRNSTSRKVSFFSDWTRNWKVSTSLVLTPKTKLRENLFRGSRAEPRGMTHERTDMTWLTVPFRHCFEKGPKGHGKIHSM